MFSSLNNVNKNKWFIYYSDTRWLLLIMKWVLQCEVKHGYQYWYHYFPSTFNKSLPYAYSLTAKERSKAHRVSFITFRSQVIFTLRIESFRYVLTRFLPFFRIVKNIPDIYYNRVIISKRNSRNTNWLCHFHLSRKSA